MLLAIFWSHPFDMAAPASKWRDNVSTSIVIDAPLALVWSVLTDFPAWSDWNPLIQPIALQPPAYSFTAHAPLTASLHLPGQSAPINMRTYLQSVHPPTAHTPTAAGFSWGGYQGLGVVMTHVFYGRHHFELVRESDGRDVSVCES